MKIRALALACAAVVALAAPALAEKPLQFHLYAQNDSGETGTATLLQSGPNVIVRVRLRNAPAEGQPEHVHKGTCAKLDPKPAYPLTLLHDGFAESTIPNVKLADFTSGTYAINVHKSATDLAKYVACGDLKLAPMKDEMHGKM